MWWSEFEKRLTRAFDAYMKREGQIVHSDSMTIWMLVDKIKADFLTPTKAQLKIELSRTPLTITYEQSLALFQNMVNQKHPPQMNAANSRTRRDVNEVSTERSSRGRGCGGRGDRGERHDKGGNRENTRTRTDSRTITQTDGTQIEYHVSFKFPRHAYLKMKQEDKDTLKREQAAYNQNRDCGSRSSELQELRSQIQELQQATGSVVLPPTDTVSMRSQVSQITTGTNVMGGRNEQANKRDARRLAAVLTGTRHVCTTKTKYWTDPPVNTIVESKCNTNAETCCLGRNFVVLHSTFRTADVYAYDTSIRPTKNAPIVLGATAYDNPDSRKTFILVFNESLYYGDCLDHTLINPNQVCAFGIPFWDNPYDTARSLSIDVDADLTVPLRAHGTKLMFRTRVPTQEELSMCEHIQMTSPHPWNPTEVSLLQATRQGGQISRPTWKRQVATVDSTYERYEYLDTDSDHAWLDSIDPSLVHLGERLSKVQRQ